MTARTDTQERVRGYKLGCDVYLAKPFDLNELGAVVRNLLERQQMIESEWRFSRGETSAAEHNEGPSTPLIPTKLRLEKPLQEEQSLVSLAIADFHLTQRERDVLSVLADGLSNVQIGEQLHLSPRTVEKYVSSLLRKTGTNNRAELLRFAIEKHLVD